MRLERSLRSMGGILGNRKIWALRFIVVLLILITFRLAGAHSGFKILPYVQSVDATSAMILWNPADGITGEVRYGTSTAYGASVEGRIEYVMTNERPQPGKTDIVHAPLVGLLPDTVYHYQVVNPEFESRDRTFRTAPADADATFTFLVYGDNRTDPQAHARVISAAAINDPAFVLHTGDMVPFLDNGQNVWRKQFFEPADLLLRKTWFPVTRGNHEEGSPLFAEYFVAPRGIQAKDYYSFDWGPVHVATINTNKNYQPGSDQYQFLEHDLASTSRPFKVFFGHHPSFSSGLHGSTVAMRVLQPLFEKYGVKLVLAGHDHDYERTLVNGINYVVTVGGGAPLERQKNVGKNPTSLVFRKANNFVQADVTPGALTLRTWAVDNEGVTKMIDRAVIRPLATFEIGNQR